MRKLHRLFVMTLITCFSAITCYSQTITISGNIKNNATSESVPAVSITVKGATAGTFTDDKGNFRLSTSQQPPFTIVISSIGFETKEVVVSNTSETLKIDIAPSSILGTEVVVSASRLPERILESPVSIERVGWPAIRNAAVPNFYEGMANLKGVDLTTSSLTFRTISTRGFNGSGNLRFNQLVDGIDNQAPGLNFSVGNIVGPAEIDVDNVELLQGASSALYGSGGLNGTLLMSSKNPFKYQGLSFQIKQGIMHTDGSQRKPAPYYDWAVRWGKKINDKFAFKTAVQFIQAKDWQAQDTRNISRNNVFSSLKPGDRQTDPNYDGVNVFGDEASTSMNSFAQAVRATVSTMPGTTPALNLLDGMIGQGQTYAQINAAFAGTPLSPYLPFLVPTSNVSSNPFRNTFGGQFVSRTGYEEKHLVDYNTYNLKLTGGLYYNINENIEASLLAYWGTGTTVYTGADRYAIKNLQMGQYKAEVKAKNWFLRAYTVQENSGDAYTATTAALYVNRSWSSDQNWFTRYTGTYAGARLGAGVSNEQAHAAARAAADQGRYLPGSQEFNAAFKQAINTSISNGGAKFEDATDLYHFEGQYNLTDLVKVVDVIVGANYRLYRLNSQGTIFADTLGPINISEVGSYIQLQKWFFKERLKITGSGRYDKNENFKGRFTPRIAALAKITENNFLRFSFQTAYRFPSTQDQYINLLTGGLNRLIGGLPEFNTFFKFNVNPAYTAESIVQYRTSIQNNAPNPALLKQAQFNSIGPETLKSFEVGYKGLLSKRLLMDLYGYYTRYKDFIGRVAVGRGKSGDPARAPMDLASPYTTDNYSFVENTQNDVKAIGWGLSINYQYYKGYEINANVSSDELSDVPSTVVTFFNTPKYRFNIGMSNKDVGKGIGFNVMYRWQDKVKWEGTFGTGNIDSYGILDAQINYKFKGTNNLIKVGASNLLNKYYRSAFGNPDVGGLYYISFGYNVF